MNYHRAPAPMGQGGIPLAQQTVQFEEPGAGPGAGDGGVANPAFAPPSVLEGDAWGQGMMPGVRTRGAPTRAITSLITCLQAPQGTMKWSPMSLPKEKGTELSLAVGGWVGENTCRRPSCTNKYGAKADFPPSSSKKTMQEPASLPAPKHSGCSSRSCPLGTPGVFLLAPTSHPSPCRLSAHPYLVMAMALKLVCPSEMAFWMAVRSAHTPRL